MEKVRPLPGSPSCYDCLWVPRLLGCLDLCFNKCCCDAKIHDLVNNNVSALTLSRWPVLPSPEPHFPNSPVIPPLPVHLPSLTPTQCPSGLDCIAPDSHVTTFSPPPLHPTPSTPHPRLLALIPYHLVQSSSQCMPSVLFPTCSSALCNPSTQMLIFPDAGSTPWRQVLPLRPPETVARGHTGHPTPLFPFAFVQCSLSLLTSPHTHISSCPAGPQTQRISASPLVVWSQGGRWVHLDTGSSGSSWRAGSLSSWL